MGRGRPKRKAAKRAGKTARRTTRAGGDQSQVENVLASLAHDIRTPLTGILALAELLAASELPARERGWAEAIKSAADHLAQSTSLVLDAVKTKSAKLVLRTEVFSPRRLAEAVAASLTARAGAGGLSADVSIADDLPASVIGDGVRLRAALENLIDNAVKFTARGSVTFEVKAKPVARNRVRLYFIITDTGIGLSPADIRKLFRPFAQASEAVSRRFGGTGLGLVLVKRLAKAMGGDLTVVSTPDKGSAFTLTVTVDRIPVSKGKSGAANPGIGAALPSLRILCAEDSPFGRVILSTILRELGHSVDFAGSGESAVTAVAKGGYDLVLMDVTLPGIDGLEATRRIRASADGTSLIPIIGISGLSTADDAKRAREAGMNDYLTKPVGPSALAEALQRLRG